MTERTTAAKGTTMSVTITVKNLTGSNVQALQAISENLDVHGVTVTTTKTTATFEASSARRVLSSLRWVKDQMIQDTHLVGGNRKGGRDTTVRSLHAVIRKVEPYAAEELTPAAATAAREAALAEALATLHDFTTDTDTDDAVATCGCPVRVINDDGRHQEGCSYGLDPASQVTANLVDGVEADLEDQAYAENERRDAATQTTGSPFVRCESCGEILFHHEDGTTRCYGCGTGVTCSAGCSICN